MSEPLSREQIIARHQLQQRHIRQLELQRRREERALLPSPTNILDPITWLLAIKKSIVRRK